MRADLLRLMKSYAYPTFLSALGVWSAIEPNFFAASVVMKLELLPMILGHRILLYQMDQIFPQAMKFQLEENTMLKSVPYSLHLLKNLVFHFSHDTLQKKLVYLFSCLKRISAATKPRIFLEAYSSEGVFLPLFGIFSSYLYVHLYITVSKAGLYGKWCLNLGVLVEGKFVKTS